MSAAIIAIRRTSAKDAAALARLMSDPAVFGALRSRARRSARVSARR